MNEPVCESDLRMAQVLRPCARHTRLGPASRREAHDGADRPSVRGLSTEPDAECAAGLPGSRGVVAEEDRRASDRREEEVQVAIAIDVPGREAPRDERDLEPRPRIGRSVRERPVAAPREELGLLRVALLGERTGYV